MMLCRPASASGTALDKQEKAACFLFRNQLRHYPAQGHAARCWTDVSHSASYSRASGRPIAHRPPADGMPIDPGSIDLHILQLSQNQDLLMPHSQSVRGQAAPERFCQ